jgi:hypothetical protein
MMKKTVPVTTMVLAATIWALLPAPADGIGEEGGSDAIECANLIYAGTRSSVCFSESFLAAVGKDSTIHTSRKFKPVKLAESELFRFPFAVMTGEGAFALTDPERRNLVRYLERGGFLLASAGCSDPAWDKSLRREIANCFPERKLEKIGMDHPVFHTLYEIEQLKTKTGTTSLEAMTMDGKLVLIYSKDGLNDTGSQHGCCCCGGNEIRNSRQVMSNILVYSLLQ